MTKEQIKTLETQLEEAMNYAVMAESATGYYAVAVIATLLSGLHDPQGLRELADETSLHNKRTIARIQKEKTLSEISQN